MAGEFVNTRHVKASGLHNNEYIAREKSGHCTKLGMLIELQIIAIDDAKRAKAGTWGLAGGWSYKEQELQIEEGAVVSDAICGHRIATNQ